MRQLTHAARLSAALLLLPLLAVQPAFGWGADGHMLINRLAGAELPADVPAFLRTPAALDALEYYGPEPDRWRSPAEPELNAAQAPEHFIDLEYADLIGPLPRRRYDYIRALAAAQAKASRHSPDAGEGRPATLRHHRSLRTPAERLPRLSRARRRQAGHQTLRGGDRLPRRMARPLRRRRLAAAAHHHPVQRMGRPQPARLHHRPPHPRAVRDRIRPRQR